MLATGKDDISNRISPRLRDFHTYEKNGGIDPDPGVVSWYKAHMIKTYCQETNGYVCQRPATSSYDADATGDFDFIYVWYTIKQICIMFSYFYITVIYEFVLFSLQFLAFHK